MTTKGWPIRLQAAVVIAAVICILALLIVFVVTLVLPSVLNAWSVQPVVPVVAVAPSAATPLTVLAAGEGVTVLEYQGAGVRCLIASDGVSVDMVCQNAPSVPVQPTEAVPTQMPKQNSGVNPGTMGT